MKVNGWGVLALFLAFTMGLACAEPKDPPREPYGGTILVGTGCAKGDLRTGIAVAWEEDHLPVCDSIDIHSIERP